MGSELLLSTRPRGKPREQHQLLIRWADFERSDVIADTQLRVTRPISDGSPETRVEFRGLRGCIDERDGRSLARELVLLSEPFGDPSGFTPEFVAPEFAELEKLVRGVL